MSESQFDLAPVVAVTARIARLATLLLGLIWLQIAAAQGFPSKPIHIIVPYAGGGVTDALARLIGQQIGDSTGQPVIVDNRPGASSIIGMQACAASPPDGYTVCMTVADSLTYNPLLFTNLPYDAERDFAPLTILAWSSSMLVANAKAPFSTYKEMVAFSKANPGKLNWGTWGPASTPDVYLRWIRRQAGIEITAIPYKGAGQAVPALFSGEVDITLYGVGNALPHIKSGRLKPVAVMGNKRSPLLPDVPSLAEENADPGLSIYFCVFAPAKTPKPIIDRLNAEFVKGLRMPRVQDFLKKDNLRAEGNSPDEFAAFLKEDRAIASKVFKAIGIRPTAAPL